MLSNAIFHSNVLVNTKKYHCIQLYIDDENGAMKKELWFRPLEHFRLAHAPHSAQRSRKAGKQKVGISEEERRRISAEHREAAKDQINSDWDQDFLRRLESPSDEWATAMTQADIDPAGVGANEVRTWLAAYAAGGQALRTVAYEPVREWLTGVGVAVSVIPGN